MGKFKSILTGGYWERINVKPETDFGKYKILKN